MNIFVFLLVCLPITVLTFECENKPDGVYDAGCKSFIKCEDGKGEGFECDEHTVYNAVIQACDDPKNVAAPCGNMINCSDKPDGHYPDLDQRCHSYYTCNGGSFFGHNFCPTGLVYHQEIEVCDYPHSVPKPCGLLDP
ncbi:hypothetical protein SNE40_006822 [Patella caerulea]|uniref:Chitin-binding type-2 domain-containing protein n=1 Tax=Patella caerulea TaxID=87958 RepID=A0AAN8K3F1_PATCE